VTTKNYRPISTAHPSFRGRAGHFNGRANQPPCGAAIMRRTGAHATALRTTSTAYPRGGTERSVDVHCFTSGLARNARATRISRPSIGAVFVRSSSRHSCLGREPPRPPLLPDHALPHRSLLPQFRLPATPRAAALPATPPRERREPVRQPVSDCYGGFWVVGGPDAVILATVSSSPTGCAARFARCT